MKLINKMIEWQFVWLFTLKLIAIFVFSIAYIIEGREDSLKLIRRYIGSGIFMVLCLIISSISGSFMLWLILPFVILMIGLTFGYGADDLKEKLSKRIIYGFVLGLAGLICGIITGHVYMGFIQISMSILASLYFGVINPVHSVDEEGIISLFSVVLIPFML